mmetsp:Transcript_8140/g.9188  ORF Transcript_8140/g.9188 Transcript_8140/m.9188 type:complete len:146 (+) Transcript_8140:58-495(+)
MSAVHPEDSAHPAHNQGEPEDYADSEDEWAAPAKELPNDALSHGTVAKVTEVNYDALEAEERELAGDVVPIVFFVPANGESFRRNYVMGHTIGYIKGQLEDLKGWPYERLILKLNGKLLIDPLSLNDLPFTARQDNTVEVTFTAE